MKYFLLLVLLCSTSVAAQAQSARPLPALAGPAGNYIYLTMPAEGEPLDAARLMATDYYLIERAALDTSAAKTGDYKEIGKARPVQSKRELRSYYNEGEIAEMLRVFEVSSEDSLVIYFQTHRNPQAFGLYYLVLKTKLASGNVYVDKSATKGVAYTYRATRVGKEGTTEIIGSATVRTGEPNKALTLFHPRMGSISTSDTSVTFGWKIPMDSLMRNLPAGIQLQHLLLTTNGLKARVAMNDGPGTKYHEVGRVIPTNDTDKTVNIYHRNKALPEQQYDAFVILEDEVGNGSAQSDTLTAFTVSPANMPVLRRMNATAVPDGVRLGWPLVKPKPYIIGVKLTRYNEDDKPEDLAVVPVADTSFVDYSTKPGITYRYFGEILFAPGLNLKQVAPVQVTGASTVFSDPLPVFNLRVSNVGSNILLEWDAQKQASIYGYYIYRGTSPKNMSLIAGPVHDRMSFTDTAHHLSGRSQYFYAVQGENYRQVMSPMSEYVAITPKRKIETVMPKSLEFFYTGDALSIRFPDVREDDNAIVGYVVRGREKGAPSFRFHSPLLSNPNTEDRNGFVKGNTYQYQVAAVSMRGDTSAYSEFYEFFLPKDPVGQLNIFYIRNTSNGVTLSWPTVVYQNRKAYNVYRRTAEEEGYTKIATVPATEFSYSDANAKADEVYVYSVSVTEMDDREGERGEAKSIQREPVKATTISE